MYFRQLSNASEFSEFVSQFKQHSDGIEFAEDYVKNSRTIGGFNEKGRMICGYLLAAGEDMRWPKLLSTRPDFLNKHPQEKISELNGVWISPELRRHPKAAKLWIQIGKDISKRNVPYVTFAVDSRKAGLLKLYRPIISGQIYSGPINIPDIPQVEVFWASRKRFGLLVPLYSVGLMKRFLRL